MNNMAFSIMLTDDENEAAILDAWLRERDLDVYLRSQCDDPLPFSVDTDRLKKAAAPHDKNVASGQIRVLSPNLISGNGSMPYIAVLDRWMEDIWLVAPFSPYSTPALTTEMTTGIPLAGQEVLQCWNARTAHESLIGRSYVMGSLDEIVRKDAIALFRHAMAGVALPSGFSAKVGVPIRAKADPRREYLAESMARYAPLTEAALGTEATLARNEILAERLSWSRNWMRNFRAAGGQHAAALAAGSAPKQQTRMLYFDGGMLAVSIMESTATLRVYDSNGNDSNVLDGYSVVAENECLGAMSDGFFQTSVGKIANGFVLVSPEDKLLDLTEDKERQ